MRVIVSDSALLSAGPMEATFVRGDRSGRSGWHWRGEGMEGLRGVVYFQVINWACFSSSSFSYSTEIQVWNKESCFFENTYQCSAWLKDKKRVWILSGEFSLGPKPKPVSLPGLEREVHSWMYFRCSFCYRSSGTSRIWITFWETICGG